MLRVLNDRILVRPDENEYVEPVVSRIMKEGTLVLPEIMEGAVKKVAMRGSVVSWGNACKYSYKMGDIVLFGRFSGSQYYLDGIKYLLLLEDDLHAKEEND